MSTDGLGAAVRARRSEVGLTLVELARRTELSHPFLSQIENGHAQPSIDSLYRIARALDTTPQAFFDGEVTADAVQVVRAGAGATVGDGGAARVLVGAGAPFRLLQFDPVPRTFGSYYEHRGFEAAYVVSGSVEVDLDGDVTRLGAGDTMSYPATVPHRHRGVSRAVARMLLVETSVDAPTHG